LSEIGIGIIGGGYMGKAHAVAHRVAPQIFGTALRSRLEMVAATSPASAEGYCEAYGFARAARDWRELVEDDRVDAVVIATPPGTHRQIVELAASLGKPIFCEKPLGASLVDARAMTAAVENAGLVAMTGFNYIRTPASQFARQLLAEGAIGDITWLKVELTEDFHADPSADWVWRAEGEANGCLGDLAPHPINAALALGGPIDTLFAEIEQVHQSYGGRPQSNDDQVSIMCRYASGARGHIFASRVATGRKMGYAYDIYGTKGAIRFDGEDQNALWLYEMAGPEATRGFRKILTGPAHPDYLPFCQGPGHGTGYQDQIIIEAKDFLEAIEAGTSRFPTFRDGLEVAEVVAAARASHQSGGWVPLSSIKDS
jgi:predicted dehydrogenase